MQSLTASRLRATAALVGRFAVFIMLAFALATCEARASDIVRIEEDWELVVGQPEPDSNAPQLTCVISPLGNATAAYAAFDINHHSQPEYSQGGLQLQVWSNEVPLLYRSHAGSAVMSHHGETVRWTQVMRIDGGTLSFEITGGSSTTWGLFGGDDLSAAVSTSLSHLNDYSPTVSVRNSGVGFAGNRVTSLVLKRVRLYSSEGLLAEDNSPRTVHPQPGN